MDIEGVINRLLGRVRTTANQALEDPYDAFRVFDEAVDDAIKEAEHQEQAATVDFVSLNRQSLTKLVESINTRMEETEKVILEAANLRVALDHSRRAYMKALEALVEPAEEYTFSVTAQSTEGPKLEPIAGPIEADKIAAGADPQSLIVLRPGELVQVEPEKWYRVTTATESGTACVEWRDEEGLTLGVAEVFEPTEGLPGEVLSPPDAHYMRLQSNA